MPEVELVTASNDGFVRLYEPGRYNRPAVKSPALQGRLEQAAFSPDGERVAVGFHDKAKVEVLSARDLKSLYVPDVTGILPGPGGMYAVAWSASTNSLIAGGSVRMTGDRWLRNWAASGRGHYEDLPAGRDAVRRLLSLRDGSVLFATMDSVLGRVSGDRVTVLQRAGRLDYRPQFGVPFLASQDGAIIEMGASDPSRRIRLSLHEQLIARDPSPDPRLAAPIQNAQGLSVTGWQNTPTPMLNGLPLNLDRFEIARALALSPDTGRVVIGTSWRLLSFDAAGRKVWDKPAEGTVWNVIVPPGGRIVVSAQADGTLRWRRLQDGAEFLSAFIAPDGHHWVAWTPHGYYAASPGGEALIGWQLDHGMERTPEFFPVWQFRDRFHRPDVVRAVLDTLDEGAALRTADQHGNQETVPAAVTDHLPPTIQIIEPPDGRLNASEPHVSLTYVVTSPSTPLDAIKIEAQIEGSPGARFEVSPQAGTPEMGSVKIEVPPKDVEISVIAVDPVVRSQPATVKMRWTGSKAEDKPSLFVLAIGVGEFKAQAEAHLIYPHADAEDFAKAMLEQQGRLYGNVERNLIVDGRATIENIKRGFAWLRARMHGPQDVAVVFLSGHGWNAPGQDIWIFKPFDFDTDNEDSYLAGDDISRKLERMPGKKILFLDSCFSGKVLNASGLKSYEGTGAMNDFANRLAAPGRGIIVFTSSMGAQMSKEDPAWGHGAFTKALLERLRLREGDSARITVNDLDSYIEERVSVLTHGQQTPTMTRSPGMPNIPIAEVE